MFNKTVVLLLLLLLILIILFLFLFYQSQNKTRSTLVINNKKINIEIADTVLKKQRGLGGRDSLSENDGMFFPYDTYGKHAFWMGGMKIPLDFIWIKDNEVVQITENVPAPKSLLDQPIILIPTTDVNSVLEVNAGFVRKNKIKVGEKITLQE